jgi:hypothetical protein
VLGDDVAAGVLSCAEHGDAGAVGPAGAAQHLAVGGQAAVRLGGERSRRLRCCGGVRGGLRVLRRVGTWTPRPTAVSRDAMNAPAACCTAWESTLVSVRRSVRSDGGRNRPVSGSGRTRSLASTHGWASSAHCQIAVNPSASQVTAHAAISSIATRGCQRPRDLRGSGIAVNASARLSTCDSASLARADLFQCGVSRR